MHSLIGDRFLRRFFGNRFYLHKVILAGDAITSPEIEGRVSCAEKPAESGCLPSEDLQKNESMLENNKTDDINQILPTHE